MQARYPGAEGAVDRGGGRHPAWHVETAAPGCFLFHCELSGQILTAQQEAGLLRWSACRAGQRSLHQQGDRGWLARGRGLDGASEAFIAAFARPDTFSGLLSSASNLYKAIAISVPQLTSVDPPQARIGNVFLSRRGTPS
jgi:hypothetical protein